MDQDKRVADYFVVAGLPDNPQPLDDVYSRDASSSARRSHICAPPITDIAVIFRSMGETVPDGYQCLETTPFGFPADLNHGSLRSPNVYLCFKRGHDKPPIVDIGIGLMADSEIVHTTPFGRPANVNNSGARTYITYRRYHETGPCNMLVVTDICIILANKGETPPHAFCIITKNLNKGMVGSDVFVCYKKSMHRPKLLCFKPEILGRYPVEDHENFPLPSSVPLFCLPMGATLESWPDKARQPRPLFSTFVLTVSDAVEKVFGAAVTFYENYPQDKLSADQKKELGTSSNRYSVHGNKSICILSHWPFFDTFEKFLHYLHTMSISGSHHLPLERYISHFMLNVPFPSPQRPRILIQLASDRISLAQPEDSPLPLSGASFRQFLRNLGPENCMMILLFALLEQKLLIHSLRPDVLTSVAEAVSMVIFPFHWQCPFIPLCPLGLADVLSAPLPYIVGVDSRYFDIYDPPYDITCVDLDTNTISICEEKRALNLKLFPKKAARTLKSTLQGIFDKMMTAPVISNDKDHVSSKDLPIDQDFKLKKKERDLELEIQEAFLRFMSSILKGYKSYLLPITKRPTVNTTDASSLFDLPAFIKSRDRAYHRFYSLVMKTQMFTRFIEERSFVSNNDAGLAFFDECAEKIEFSIEGHDYRLLESDDSQKSDRTVFIAPPEPIGLPFGAVYTYREFGSLSNDLFIHPTSEQPHIKQKLKIKTSSHVPNSPLAKRTKQEVRSALKQEALNVAYEVLVKMQSSRLQSPDEVCYRVLMQLCGLYSTPILAVRVLFEMKKYDINLNAITYGFYNKAVLESEWPSAKTRALLNWIKVRNVVMAVAQFKSGRRSRRTRRSLSLNSDLDLDPLSRTSSRNSNVNDANAALINQNTEFVNDLIKVEDTIVKDDRSSTGKLLIMRRSLRQYHCKIYMHFFSGGQSDIGYCSMNQEDTKKSTSSIASHLSQTGVQTSLGTPTRSSNSKVFSKPRLPSSTTTTITKRFADFRASDEFRSKVGSIVRKSGGSIGGVNKLYDSSIDSSAGILITGQTSFQEDSVFMDINSVSPGTLEETRKRHKSESESSYSFGKDKVDFRSRHYSGSAIKRESPTYLDKSGENNGNKDLQMYSEDFGCDAKIICRIGSKCEKNLAKKKSVPIQENNVGRTVNDTNVHEGDLIGLNDSLIVNPQALSRPRSPNIPIRNRHSKHEISDDSLGAFDDKDLNNLADSNDTYSSPSKDSWFNLDILGSLPRMTSSLSSSLGLNGNGSSNPLSSWSVSLGSKSAKISRSATYSDDPNSTDLNKRLMRSSTLPVSESPSQEHLPTMENEGDENEETLSNNSWFTPIKNNFRRTESFRIKQGLTNLRTKASSAANSVACKFTEIKQSMSASNTPNKENSARTLFEFDRLSVRSRNMIDEDTISRGSADRIRLSVDNTYLSSRNPSMCSVNSEEVGGSVEETYLTNKYLSFPGSNDSSRPGSLHHVESSPLICSFYQRVTPEAQTDSTSLLGQSANIAMEIIMTSCSKCHVCNNLLYDEEIICGWSADDSNLNTQ
ncbi:DENN domain-containing protein 4C [Nymphon striatum]|nr:DENN domain-containing protein 4C [Nymphon striatum]